MQETVLIDNPIAEASSERHDSTSFLQALDAQLHCYRRLEELSREQTRQIQTGDTERLLETLQRRQVYLESVGDHERQIGPVKRGWPGTAEHWQVGLQEKAEAMLGEIKDLLGRITARDRQDMLALQQRRLVVGQQIQQSQTDDRNVRRINQTYATAAYGKRPGTMDIRR